MLKRILITGGAVSAKLDAVKKITNGFKGGLMMDLAKRLANRQCQVTFLTEMPPEVTRPIENTSIRIERHNGFESYREAVLTLSPRTDAVILGAAVANLIPQTPLVGKFPSHDYKIGDVIPINFVIAPRIINEVKERAPSTHLFGFKLLSGVDHDELIRAAYEIVLDAHCTAVFANDRTNLNAKFAVTKERAVHPLTQEQLDGWIWESICDEYYHTQLTSTGYDESENSYLNSLINSLIHKYRDQFVTVEEGLIFGTVAVRCGSRFITTGRGKKELSNLVVVKQVDHDHRQVHAIGTTKPTLNAPLLDTLFHNCPEAITIVHYHQQEKGLPTDDYAPPGTVRDSQRPFKTSFNITDHGCFLLLDKNGKQI